MGAENAGPKSFESGIPRGTLRELSCTLAQASDDEPGNELGWRSPRHRHGLHRGRPPGPRTSPSATTWSAGLPRPRAARGIRRASLEMGRRNLSGGETSLPAAALFLFHAHARIPEIRLGSQVTPISSFRPATG